MYLILLLIGFASSAYGMMIGAGGGFILVPLLLLIYGLSPEVAAGTGLFIVLISSLSGLYAYVKKRQVLFKMGLLVSVGAVPGTLLGRWLLVGIEAQLFYTAFALLMIGLGVFLMIKSPPKEEVASGNIQSASIHLLPLIGCMIGMLSSFFGVGGGFLLVPILVFAWKLPFHQAAGTSIFALVIYSFVGTVPSYVQGQIDWYIAFWSGIGVLIGSQIGVYVSSRLKAVYLTRLLAILVIGIGISLVV